MRYTRKSKRNGPHYHWRRNKKVTADYDLEYKEDGQKRTVVTKFVDGFYKTVSKAQADKLTEAGFVEVAVETEKENPSLWKKLKDSLKLKRVAVAPKDDKGKKDDKNKKGGK